MTREQELQSMACKIAGLCEHKNTHSLGFVQVCDDCDAILQPWKPNPDFTNDFNACLECLVPKLMEKFYFIRIDLHTTSDTWVIINKGRAYRAHGEKPLAILFLEALAQTPIAREVK